MSRENSDSPAARPMQSPAIDTGGGVNLTEINMGTSPSHPKKLHQNSLVQFDFPTSSHPKKESLSRPENPMPWMAS
jgi:hypothetical protein